MHLTHELAQKAWYKVGDYRVEVICDRLDSLENLGLSPREAQVVHCFALGNSGPQVAEIMGISPHTVGSFKRRIFDKLGVKTMAGATSILVAHFVGGEILRLRPGEEIPDMVEEPHTEDLTGIAEN